MTDTATAAPATNSPFHQPARDNTGRELPSLQTHTQKPDTPRPTAVELAHMTPEQRGAHERSELDFQTKSGPDFVHTRARDGSVVITDRATGETIQGDAPAGDQPAPPAPQGEKFKIGQYEVSEAELGAMMARQAADDQRRLTLPATPEAYEAKLPPDLKLPGGLEYKFDNNDPTLAGVRNWAHSKNLSQDDFSQLIGLYAGHVAQQEAVLAEKSRAEIAKAGINSPQRVDAVGKWITAEVGEADAKPIRATIVTDSHLRFYEKMMSKITSQGTPSFDAGRGRARETEGRVTQEQYGSMSNAERLNYARQFPQEQFTNRR